VLTNASVDTHAFVAASEAACKSESGEGKLDESQGRKASGLHDIGHLPAGLPLKCALKISMLRRPLFVNSN
jgi:hypothetical protein